MRHAGRIRDKDAITLPGYRSPGGAAKFKPGVVGEVAEWLKAAAC